MKRRKLAVSKKQVTDYVREKSQKQVLGAPQRAAGQTISEDDNRWMMDLIDVSPAAIPAGSWKFFLVCVNLNDRNQLEDKLPRRPQQQQSYGQSHTL